MILSCFRLIKYNKWCSSMQSNKQSCRGNVPVWRLHEGCNDYALSGAAQIAELHDEKDTRRGARCMTWIQLGAGLSSTVGRTFQRCILAVKYCPRSVCTTKHEVIASDMFWFNWLKTDWRNNSDTLKTLKLNHTIFSCFLFHRSHRCHCKPTCTVQSNVFPPHSSQRTTRRKITNLG